jgi:hypothetical protein
MDASNTTGRFITKQQHSFSPLHCRHTLLVFFYNSQNTTCFGCSIQPSSAVTLKKVHRTTFANFVVLLKCPGGGGGVRSRYKKDKMYRLQKLKYYKLKHLHLLLIL